MNLTWDRLRILDAIARTGSVTRAAHVLHMTGPAISQQLRKIEAETKTKVAEPSGRGVKLTPIGEALAERARLMSDIMQEVENDIEEFRDSKSLLRVGAPASVIRESFANLIATMEARWPGTMIQLEDGETVTHLQQLQREELDLVVAESWDALPLDIPARVRSRTMGKQPLEVALWEGHSLANRESISFSQLASMHWTTCARESGAHVALTQAARREGVEIDVRYFVGDHETQRDLIRRKVAVGCLPRTNNCQGLVFIPLVEELSREMLVLVADKVSPIAVQRALSLIFTSTRDACE